MVRKISSIIEEASTEKELDNLIELWDEIANNKYKYTLTEIAEARDKIKNLALVANGSDLKKSKFYYALQSQIININNS